MRSRSLRTWERPILVVVAEIPAEKPQQVKLVEDDEVIDDFATHCSNERLDVAILPWRTERAPGLRDAKILHGAIECSAVDPSR